MTGIPGRAASPLGTVHGPAAGSRPVLFRQLWPGERNSEISAGCVDTITTATRMRYPNCRGAGALRRPQRPMLQKCNSLMRKQTLPPDGAPSLASEAAPPEGPATPNPSRNDSAVSSPAQGPERLGQVVRLAQQDWVRQGRAEGIFEPNAQWVRPGGTCMTGAPPEKGAGTRDGRLPSASKASIAMWSPLPAPVVPPHSFQGRWRHSACSEASISAIMAA
jgi:hypothetical protein